MSGYHLILLGHHHNQEQYLWGCPVFNPHAPAAELTCSEANHLLCSREAW